MTVMESAKDINQFHDATERSLIIEASLMALAKLRYPRKQACDIQASSELHVREGGGEIFLKIGGEFVAKIETIHRHKFTFEML